MEDNVKLGSFISKPKALIFELKIIFPELLITVAVVVQLLSHRGQPLEGSDI